MTQLSTAALEMLAADFDADCKLAIYRLRLRFGTPRLMTAGVAFRLVVELVDEMAQPPPSSISSILSQRLNDMELCIASTDRGSPPATLSYCCVSMAGPSSPLLQWKFDCVITAKAPTSLRIQVQARAVESTLKLSRSHSALQAFCVGSQSCTVGTGHQVLILPVLSDLIQVVEPASAAHHVGVSSSRCLRVFQIHGQSQDKIHIEEDYGHAMGSHIWDASIWLSLALLLSSTEKVDHPQSTQCILELGSGCGLFAVVCAHLVARAESQEQVISRLVATEKSDNLGVLTSNLSRNGIDASSAIVRELLWGQPLDAQSIEPVGVVYAADVLYHWSAHEPLLATLSQLVDEATSTILIHKHRGVETSRRVDSVVSTARDGACTEPECQWRQWRVERLARVASIDFVRLTKRPRDQTVVDTD